MRSRTVRWAAFLGGALLVAGAAVSCGDRTGLPLLSVDDEEGEKKDHSSPDASLDGDTNAEEDAVSDVPLPEEDAVDDTFDNNVPDVIVDNCPDSAATLIYLVTTTNQLLSFYPPTATFTTIGTLGCPEAMPFSMAVNRHGVAWVVSMDDKLYRVSTDTAACQVVKKYTPGQDGFDLFGMGFVAGIPGPDGGGDAGGDIDQLFIAGYDADGGLNSPLGILDTSSFVLTDLGDFHPDSLFDVELTGTGDGRLFAYYQMSGAIPPYGIAQIDPRTAAVMQEWPVAVDQGDAWAFAFWGGDFYLFTSGTGDSGSEVHRFDPSDGSLTFVTNSAPGQIIDGAGVSTCAPVGDASL
jgi:hypothetical protein